MDFLICLLFLITITIFEPFVINFIYFSNVDLFIDLFLTKKNEKKLYNCVLKRLKKED